MRFCFVSKKLRFGSGIIGWVFVCVFCKQNAKMTKFVRKIVIFEFCKQNTLTVTLCRMPEPYLSFLQTEFKNVILAIFFVNILLGAPELWCPGTRSLVPFQADQGKGHQSSGARAPEVWCPSKLTNRFFVLISRMGFGTLIFCCLPIVFMCSTQNLVLSEHGQHEWACSDEKTLKK